jgi:hypothetical protein
VSDDIDFSTLSLPIPKGEWRDTDERIFQACFTILGQFVENELGPETTVRADLAAEGRDPDRTTFYRGYRVHSCGGNDEKAIDLWLWYTIDLPALEAAYDADIEEVYSGDITTKPVPNNPMLRELVFPPLKREPKYPHDYPETVKEQKLAELIALRRALWT